MMGWFANRREKRDREAAAVMAMRVNPPITVQQHRWAQVRLAEQYAKFTDTAIGRIATGVIHMDDLRLAHGYSLVLKGYDKWGWPAGHAESPEQVIYHG